MNALRLSHLWREHRVAQRSLGKQLWNLLLACINATLILVALCLWLAWGAFSAVDSISENVAVAAGKALAVEDELRTLRQELVDTRTALIETRDNGVPLRIEAENVSQQLAMIDGHLTDLNAQLAMLARDPEGLVEAAVDHMFERLGAAFSGRFSSVLPEVPSR